MTLLAPSHVQLSSAETTQNSGFTRDGKKTGVSHPALVPRAIILDGEVAMHTPLWLFLSSGMRAVDHAIECLYRPGDVQWLLRGQYLAALRELFVMLRRCKEKPDDVDTRQRLQIAAVTSLFPESRKGALGLSHGELWQYTRHRTTIPLTLVIALFRSRACFGKLLQYSSRNHLLPHSRWQYPLYNTS